VVTGISEILEAIEPGEFRLQWGPVVVTGISAGRSPRGNAHLYARPERHGGAASMGSGRGDRNQPDSLYHPQMKSGELQWGPVVVTGIRRIVRVWTYSRLRELQWGPVVVTGIRRRSRRRCSWSSSGFNGVRSW